MIRIAHGNGYKIHDFYAEFFGRERQIWTRDIDHHAPAWLIEALSERTGQTTERIRATTLRAYESYAFETFNETGSTRWIMPVGVYHRIRRVPGQQFCPLCLNEDDIPYLRRAWRLSLVAACSCHSILLQDRCAACGKPVVAHRADTAARRNSRGRLGLHRCVFCRADLAAPVVGVEWRENAVQQAIEKTLHRGFTMMDGRPVHSVAFFDGLKTLIRGLARVSPLGMSQAFDRSPAPNRLARLCDAFELLNNWPEAFREFGRRIAHPYTTFARGTLSIPYWLDAVLRADFLQVHAPLSKEEARAIATAAGAFAGSVSPTSMRRLSGRDASHLVRKPPLDHATADRLMHALDRRAASLNGERRMLVLRDKAMFALARRCGLSMPQLARLRIDDWTIVPDPNFSPRGPLRTKNSVDAMIGWYSSVVRPTLRSVAPDTRHLFLTREGRPMQPGALGMRFDQATREADLVDDIPSWGRWIGR